MLGVDVAMNSLNRSLVCIFVFSVPALAGSSVEGINNFFQVDGHVYRGAQPTKAGFEYLAKIGVKTVLDLRESGKRAEEEEQTVTALGFKYVNIAMSGLTPPTEDQISKILALLEGTSTGAVFVHCMRGADRTGAVIAAYRIDHDHWTNDRALEEAKSEGMSFFQTPRKDYIRNFYSLVSVAKIAPASDQTTVPGGTAPAAARPAASAMQ
jgi:protein tyrosine/serine phosphatase